jgi:hypothetical protein
VANQLTKLTSITYVPAVPEQLPQPAYCIMGSQTATPALDAWMAYLQGKPYQSQFLTCFPAKPYSPGRDAQLNTSANLGWNAGAVSIFSAPADCVLSFSIPISTLGALVGLQPAGQPAAQFGGITHGLLMASDTIRVIEAGVEKAEPPMPTPPVNPQVRKLLGTKQGQELLRQAGKGQELTRPATATSSCWTRPLPTASARKSPASWKSWPIPRTLPRAMSWSARSRQSTTGA